MDRQILTEENEPIGGSEKTRPSKKDAAAVASSSQHSPSSDRDSSKGGSQDSSQGTVEYHSSNNVNDDEEDTVSLDLPVKTSGLQNLNFTKSTKMLVFYGVTSILLGLIIICCGVVAFNIQPTFRPRHSYQIESKWANLVVIFSGVGGLLLVYKKTITSMCATLIFSLLAAPVGFCTMIVHIVNLHMRSVDMEYYRYRQPDMFKAAMAVGDINVALMVAGGLSCAISLLLYRHTLHIAGKNFGYTIQVDKQRLRLSMVGMTQIIVGVFITGFWIGIETLMMSMSIDFHALPTSEVLSHGLVICAAGYIQMMATAKGNQPMLVCSAVLNGISLLLATFFSAHPLSLLYMVVKQGQGTTLDIMLDMRLVLLGFLSLFYILEIMLAVYSLIKFAHHAAGDRISRIDNMLHKFHRLLTILAWIQIIVGVLYAFAEIFGVSLFYLYKLDFTPLPVFILCSGVIAYGAVRMGSPMLISISCALCCLCISFSLRDLYLFAYHALYKGLTPDNPTVDKMTGLNLTVHLFIALLSLVESILAPALLYTFLRALLGSIACLYNHMQFPKTLPITRYLSYLHTAFGVCVIIAGFVLVFNKLIFLGAFGDMSVTVGLLLTTSGLLQVFSRHKPVLLLPSLFAQILAFTLVWIQVDAFAYLMHNYLGEARLTDEELEAGRPILSMAFVVFTLLVLYLFMAGANLFLQGSVLEDATFSKLEMNKKKVEEMISFGANKDNEKTVLEFVEDE